MMLENMNRLRRLCCAALSAVLLTLCLCTAAAPAAAESIDDTLADYAQTLASELNYSAGSVVTSGSGASNFTLKETTATAGRRLYVIELKTGMGFVGSGGVSASSADRLDCAVFYFGFDGKVHWTDDFNFTKNAAEFMGKNAAASGGTDVLSISLPPNCLRILALCFHKAGSQSAAAAWSGDWVRIVQVTGSIGELKTENGAKSRAYNGVYVAGTSALTELNSAAWGSHLWRLSAEAVSTGGIAESTKTSDYLLELVTGSDGYAIGSGSGGTIAITYQDISGASATKTVDFASALTAVYPDSTLSGAAGTNNWKTIPLSTDWQSLSDREMTGLASGYLGNYYSGSSYKEACLAPYSATCFQLTLPQTINEITSITVTLANSDSLSVQSMRLLELTSKGSNYFNGSLSAERACSWTGKLVAKTTSSTQTVSGKGSWTWQKGSSTATGLESYAYGGRTTYYGSGTGVGVSVQFADISGAGVETLLADNLVSPADSSISFGLKNTMKSQVSNDAVQALHSLGAFYQEPMTLEVTYKDTFGSTRRVCVPFMTTYLLCALQQNGGRLTGGSWQTWISGIFQQNENAALTLRLSEYQSLVSVKLTYGSTPAGITSSNTGSIDTASDSVAIENLCIYENVTTANFKTVYSTSHLALTLNTTLTPSYSWKAASEQGKQLSSGGAITANSADGTLQPGAPAARSEANKYLITIKTADIEHADSVSDMDVTISYTDTSGAKKSTPAYALRSLVNAFYGAAEEYFVAAGSSEQYIRHRQRGSSAAFVLELPNVGSIDSITLSLKADKGGVIDSWQMESVTVYRLSALEQRTGTRTNYYETSLLTWERSYSTANKAAYACQSVLLYLNSPTKTIYFTGYSETGEEIKPDLPVKTEEYLTTLPATMTYEDTLKDLGLTVVKCNYRIDVEVADLDDAGSTNYFYFQLVFENGTSAVVLANQQLASDSFRQGCIESFRIKTTQNYGNVTAVRIICDASSSTSDVFDKLNISSINVTLSGESGVSKTWIVENIGWIDITYVDEGEDQGIDGLESTTVRSVSNADITREFPVSRMATAVDLLFCITTAAESQRINGDVEATLVYLDGNGVEQSKKFDLKSAICEYNDTVDKSWHFRPSHIDRFRLTMTDISSVSSLIISRSGEYSAQNWVVKSVSVLQIGGLGDVYLSTDAEFYRDPVSSTPLTTSTNAAGTAYTIGPTASVTIPFNENHIDVVEDSADDSVWSATITRLPTSGTERLNVTVYPVAGYRVASSTATLTATAKYNTLYGDILQQTAFQFSSLGTLDGSSVLYTKSMEVSTMSLLHSLTLSAVAGTGSAPTISKAVVQRVRGNVLLDTYLFDYGSHSLDNPTAALRPTVLTGTPMHQTLTLQLAAGQSRVLTAETNDIAVALRYTSSLDPAETKTVYQTPYVFFTDADCTSLQEGQLIEIPFDVTFVDSIVGLSIVSTGEPLAFDNAYAVNCSGARDAAAPTVLSTASFADAFSAGTIATEVAAGDEPVVPITFTFTTADEAVAAGAGTSGRASLTIAYLDAGGHSRSMPVDNLLRRLSAAPTAGSSVSLRVLLSGLTQLESLTIEAEDSWFLTGVTAQPETVGDTQSATASVNQWARSGEPLTIEMGGFERHNYVQTFSVTAMVNGEVYSAASGSTLTLGSYAGGVVTLTPTVTAVGSPDTGWTWNASGWDGVLSVHADGTADFLVPDNWGDSDSATFSVTSNADNRLSVTVTIFCVPLAEDDPTTAEGDDAPIGVVDADPPVGEEEPIGGAVAGEDEPLPPDLPAPPDPSEADG